MKKYTNTLVVDDDPISCFINRKIIELTNLTENISIVHNGADALDYLKERFESGNFNSETPNLIFLDLNMPVMDGFEFLLKLESLEKGILQNLEVVVLTSSSNDLDISKVSHHFVKAYLNKPLSVSGLKNLFGEKIIKEN